MERQGCTCQWEGEGELPDPLCPSVQHVFFSATIMKTGAWPSLQRAQEACGHDVGTTLLWKCPSPCGLWRHIPCHIGATHNGSWVRRHSNARRNTKKRKTVRHPPPMFSLLPPPRPPALAQRPCRTQPFRPLPSGHRGLGTRNAQQRPPIGIQQRGQGHKVQGLFFCQRVHNDTERGGGGGAAAAPCCS